MVFEELKDNVEDVQENTKAYVESSIAYYKLWGFKVAMKSTTLILKFILISICIIIFLLFLSVAAALAIGKLMDNYVVGFLIVAGVYFVLTLLLFTIKNKIVEGPILEKFSDIFFNE